MKCRLIFKPPLTDLLVLWGTAGGIFEILQIETEVAPVFVSTDDLTLLQQNSG